MTTKTCSRCQKEQPLTGFSKNKRAKDGYQNQCKQCFKDRYRHSGQKERYAKKYREGKPPSTAPKQCSNCGLTKEAHHFSKNPANTDGLFGQCKSCSWEKERNRKYGFRPGEFIEMLKAQDHKCKICRKPCPTKQTLSVDHCHTTGTVRGLLCNQCNRAIGMLKDDPDLIERAAHYVRHDGEI